MKLLLPALLCGALALAQEQGGSIAGTVVDSVSHLPVRKAQVLLMWRQGMPRQMMPRGGPPAPPLTTALTDAAGGFTFTGLAPGTYDVQAGHPRYPQRPMGLPRRPVIIKAGEETRVTVELIPPATVSGRVLDEDGDPVTGCMVQLIAAGSAAREMNFEGPGSASEGGLYRVPNILPGRYIAASQCQRPVFQPRPLSAGPPAPPSLAYAPQYYPLTDDPKGAQILELGPGVEKAGVDFRMKMARVYSVRGSLSSVGTDWRTRTDLVLTLVPRDRDRIPSFGMMGAHIDRTKGTFEFQSVFPGAYTLIAYTQGDGNAVLGVRQPLEVSDRPLEINLELRPGAEVSGTVEIGGDQKVQPGGIQIQMTSVDPFGSSPGATAREDGTFTVKGLTPGIWQVRAFGRNTFVQSVTADGRELPDHRLDTSSGSVGPLRIVLSTKTATIRGTGPPERQVRILPVSDREGFSSMSSLDYRGEFVFRGLPPGKYRVSLEDGGPDGKEVTVAEGETVTVELKAPSSP